MAEALVIEKSISRVTENEQVRVTKSSVLKAFDKKNNSSNETSEAEALELLSRLPHPAAVRDEDECKLVRNLTLLHHACHNGWYAVAKVLIEKHGCDPECRTSIDSTPLLYSYQSGNVKLVKYLISEVHCDPLHVNTEGMTRLHYACQGGQLHMVKYLIEKDKYNPAYKYSLGWTPLHTASEKGQLNVAKYLIEETAM